MAVGWDAPLEVGRTAHTGTSMVGRVGGRAGGAEWSSPTTENVVETHGSGVWHNLCRLWEDGDVASLSRGSADTDAIAGEDDDAGTEDEDEDEDEGEEGRTSWSWSQSANTAAAAAVRAGNCASCSTNAHHVDSRSLRNVGSSETYITKDMRTQLLTTRVNCFFLFH
jgi:hypothetical protein